MNTHKTLEKGDVVDVVIIIIAILFLLIVFKIDILGWIHALFLKIASAF